MYCSLRFQKRIAQFTADGVVRVQGQKEPLYFEMRDKTTMRSPAKEKSKPQLTTRTACDGCHAAKIRCSGGVVCEHCQTLEIMCIYSNPKRVGRPPGSRNKANAAKHLQLTQQTIPSPESAEYQDVCSIQQWWSPLAQSEDGGKSGPILSCPMIS